MLDEMQQWLKKKCQAAGNKNGGMSGQNTKSANQVGNIHTNHSYARAPVP